MKRTAILFLVFSLVLCLVAGCGTTNSASNEKSEVISATDTPETEQPATVDETEQPEEVEETEEPVGYELPLADEPYTLTMLVHFQQNLASLLPNGFGDIDILTQVEDLLGIHLEFTEVETSQCETQFAILSAAESLPDIIAGYGSFTHLSKDSLIDDGLFVDLAQYINEEDAPCYYALLEEKGYLDALKTDKGYVVAFASVSSDNSPTMTFGPMIRSDYLEAVNMESPVTYDDYYNVLKAFQTELGIEHPLQLPTTALPTMNYLGAGFGVAAASYSQFGIRPFYVDNGTVKFAPMEEGFTELMSLLQDWYKEGLIDPDFISRPDYLFTPPTDLIMSGKAGIFYCSMMATESFMTLADEGSDFAIEPIVDARQNADDELHFVKVGGSTKMDLTTGYAISAGCTDESFEMALKYLDFWFSDKGTELYNYGIEDYSFYVDDAGEKHFTDLIVNNPDGLTYNQTNRVYLPQLIATSYVDVPLIISTYSELEQACLNDWTYNADSANIIPDDFSLNAEETEQVNEMYTDIGTLLSEYYSALISCEKSLDEIDDLHEQLIQSGIEDIIAIYQQAWDRYSV